MNIPALAFGSVDIFKSLFGKDYVVHIVSTSDKFINVKLDVQHISDKELAQYNTLLADKFGNQFISVKNGLSQPKGGRYYPKITVRFSKQEYQV